MLRPPCYLCGSTIDVQWCPRCGVWLCQRCRRDWPARARGALSKLIGGLKRSIR